MTATGYLETLPFTPDRFQREAAEALDAGESVVVTAPTGAGKTVVAESAIALASERHQRVFYTTPVKALSNQKFGDLRAVHGADAVGLLTGDNSVNGAAPIVVMTTEVLRNMMYQASPDLEDVSMVVLDEVHYLQDRERGAVWEEIIIHLDRRIRLVCLSATIANAGEFAEWVRDRRGPTRLVVETERPVPLESTYLIRDRWERGAVRLIPMFHGGRPNQRIGRMLRASAKGRRRYAAPRRFETADHLREKGLLPAIYFVFSRRGCNDAVDAVVSRGLRLTSQGEAAEIAAIAARNTAHLTPADLSVIGYQRWLRGLEAGIAPHHAGLVPAMKETVEELFAAGLVRLVFATETLAVGINMPARSVVLESLSKFTGEGHELLQPGDYTQLTGRAGRRGIDQAGTAVVLHSPYVEFERAAGIAGAGAHPLVSSFRPTYNMAVNLIARYDRPLAEELLTASFAEFADSRSRRAAEAALADDQERLTSLEDRARSQGADGFALLAAAEDAPRRRLDEFAGVVRPGDILQWEEASGPTRYVLVARGSGKQPRLLMISEHAEIRRVSALRVPSDVVRTGSLDLPRPFRPRDGKYRRRVASRLAEHTPEKAESLMTSAPELDAGERSALEAARTAQRLRTSIERRRSRARRTAPGVLRTFRATMSVLEEWGYTDGWSLTEKGVRLRSIYNEADLLVAETVHRGWLEGMDGPETAAIASSFTFQPRRDDPERGWPGSLTAVGARIDDLAARLTAAEEERGLKLTRTPNPGFAALAADWAAGATLEDLFGTEEEAAVGDFVRNCRQLVDLLGQVRDLSDNPPSGVVEAISGVDRGVVAAAGAL